MRLGSLVLMATMLAPAMPALSADGDDAFVEGTPYHAIGFLECKVEDAPDFGQCDFGVIRGGDGTAEVVITLPDGYDRRLYFADGEFTTEGDPVETTSDDDGFMAIVDGREEYRIPYIVIQGDI